MGGSIEESAGEFLEGRLGRAIWRSVIGLGVRFSFFEDAGMSGLVRWNLRSERRKVQEAESKNKKYFTNGIACSFCALSLLQRKQSGRPSRECMGSSVAEFPVPQKTLTLDIKGNKTDLVICRYDDHIMVIVTQIGAMGTILHARKEEGVSIDPTFNVSVVFGKRDELIEHISNSRASRQLVLSLGLKDHSSETLKGVVSAVIENRLW
ncbi:hypothetical protein EUGRSUZ_I01785 [Eucalyptus grandis]|uniref:Uncharacterized protein n=2 Tax=Eucalyptus grandis TaxID=71139 RepID=A0ACC3JG29_EUCGR|nr:hypothetical protein EUGRSUZ_I01785 [Eucalyptus grandis]